MAGTSCILKKCPVYKTCSVKKNPFQDNKICKGYLRYINQDIAKRKGSSFEIPFSTARIREEHLQDQVVFQPFSDRGKLIIQLFFFDKLSPVVIAEQLYCSDQFVYKVIRQCKALLMTMVGHHQKKKQKTTRKKK